jgi:hypothetical protein
MAEDRAGEEHSLGITDAEVAAWPWLRENVEKRDGAYFSRVRQGLNGRPRLRVQDLARRLGMQVRCIDGMLRLDVAELRRRVEEHHWLREVEGFGRCPECGTDW